MWWPGEGQFVVNVDRRWRVVAVVVAAFGVVLMAGMAVQRGHVGTKGFGVAYAEEEPLPPAGMVIGPRPVAVTVREAASSKPLVTVLAAGDIASCDGTGDEQTAAIVAVNPDVPVLTLGDHAYVDGTAAEFRDCFDPSWGPFKDRLRPVPGNHEYHSSNADPYFAYFGPTAGPSDNPASRGYYSFDLGAWHIVALNSEQDIGASGAQLAWLRADLAATDKRCVLAYWHRPRFVADDEYSDIADVAPFWSELYAAGAEIVLNGHSHTYQRYELMSPSGDADPTGGIREFVVGTGGRSAHSLRPDGRREAEFSGPGFFGVLKLRLSDTGYDWSFLPVAGQTYTDSGSGVCK